MTGLSDKDVADAIALSRSARLRAQQDVNKAFSGVSERLSRNPQWSPEFLEFATGGEAGMQSEAEKLEPGPVQMFSSRGGEAPARTIATHGYTVEPAIRGGWLVTDIWRHEGDTQRPLGCFSSAQDLLTFLRNQHAVRAPFDKDNPVFAPESPAGGLAHEKDHPEFMRGYLAGLHDRELEAEPRDPWLLTLTDAVVRKWRRIWRWLESRGPF